MNVLVFNIETVPDIDGGQRIHKLQGLDDESTAKALFHLRQQKSGSRELPLSLQRIASISVVYRGMSEDMEHEVSLKSLGDENSTEAELLTLFFAEVEERTPTLVSWNGSSFDLPVVHYRSLKNNVSAPNYWEKGHNDNSFRNDDYLSRYHDRHTDLMDVLSSYNESAGAPLNEIALMLGFPGREMLNTDLIWEKFMKGEINEIRHYGELGVLNNYLVYLRFQLIRGGINQEELSQEFSLLREKLDQTEIPHLKAFSQVWRQ